MTTPNTQSVTLREAITRERLMELLAYDPETGQFSWISSPGRRAGSITDRGYANIRLDGKSYRLHRLAWLYVHGEWPKADIDHINGVKHDNRIVNLRDVTRSMNMHNIKKAFKTNNSSGFLGVVRTDKRKKRPWKAQIEVNGKTRSLGTFNTPEEAHQRYLEVKRQVHAGYIE